MPENGTRKFMFKHDKSWTWHIGAFLCIEPKSIAINKRDIYLFFCFGHHDFSIGMITDYDSDNEYLD